MHDLRDDLLNEFRRGRVLIVVGSGVSLAASGKDVAGWPGLLRSGLDHLLRLRKVSQDWADRRDADIGTGQVATLVGVAQEIISKLGSAEYKLWLDESVGSLWPYDRSVIEALRRLDVPIATTNYDNLIEVVTGLPSVTWQNPHRFVQVATTGGGPRGVLHLHGHYDAPDSIVLGTMDYATITNHRAAQDMQRALSTLKTLVLVGFGGGLDDPNFEALRTWMRQVWGDAGLRHYRLCLEREWAALDKQHEDERITPLVYGSTYDQLAPFLFRLGDALGRPPIRRRTRSVGPRGRRTDAGRPRRSVPWRALLAVVAAVVVGLVVVQAVRSALGPTAAASCPIPQELIVLTTPTKEASVRERAVAFGDQPPGQCRRSSITVFSVPSASAVAGALAAGWPYDDLRLGPQPAVWLPDATAEVERVNQHGDDLESLGSIATSPVVLAMPRSAKAKLGDTSKVPWRTMVGWARQDAPGPRLRIARPDPTSSTAGLLATIGFNAATSGSATPYTQRHAIERTIDPAADELAELCELGQSGGPARAVIVPEQVMVAYNRKQLGGSCAAAQQRSDRLAAVYAADGTPVLDHPFVLLPAAVELEDRKRLARAFFEYLTSEPAQKELREDGFRDLNRRVGGTVGEQDGVLVHDPPTWASPPDGATVVRELDAWQQARLPARALLAIDVSGSMAAKLPGPGGQRITAAREAASQAVDLMGDRDQIGLWRFSQSLDGPRDYQERVPLGPAGDQRRRERVMAELERLNATPQDTGLYDTMYAGIGHLRTGSGSADVVEALIVVTDGKNDDPNGGVGLDAVRRRLDNGDEVLLFLLTFGPARCDAAELGQLSRNRERVRCLDADRIGLERAFEQVAATLWGTGRLAARGGG